MRTCRLSRRFREPDILSTAGMTLLVHTAPLFCGKHLSRRRSAVQLALSALHFFRFRRKTGARVSRQNRKYAGGKAGAAFWFGKTDDDDRAGLWHLIKVS